MALSKRSFEMILDLIENKLSCMEGWDQATARERSRLEACRRELLDMRKTLQSPSNGLSSRETTLPGHQA